MRAWLAALAALVTLAAAPAPEGVALDVVLAKSPASKLSDYRLFVDGRPNAALTAYDLNTPLFSDYAEKARFLYLPPGTKARYRADGVFDFPVGATLVKTFAYPADFRRPADDVRWLETRLLIRKRSGWVALAYVWNAERTEAVLKRAGARLGVAFTDAAGRARQVDYAVPNQNQCKECHQLSRRLVPIGPRARNLNGDYAYAHGRENQLAYWSRIGLLTGAPDPKAAPRTARWDDPAEPLAGGGREEMRKKHDPHLPGRQLRPLPPAAGDRLKLRPLPAVRGDAAGPAGDRQAAGRRRPRLRRPRGLHRARPS
jgi:cytochrome c551/c552